MGKFRSPWLWLPIVVLAACRSEEGRGLRTAMTYPETPRGEISDAYFGTTVADPYRWLEQTDSPSTDAWIDAQNAISEPFLEAIPARQRYIDRLTKLWNHERFGLPVVRGGRYFWTRNDGLQNQAVLYVADRLDGAARVLLDPNGLSNDGTKALASWVPSLDGRHLAFGISDGGSDWNEWRVLVVATGEQLPDRIGRMKFSGVSWDASGQGFFYSRYPLGAEGRGNDRLPVTIHHHTLGRPQDEDPLVCDLKHPTRNPYGAVTDDGRYLIVTLFDGYETNAVHYQDLATPGAEVVPLLDAWDARYGFLGNVGSRFYFETTLGAPRKRIVEIDVNGDRSPKEVVPQSEHVLEGASLVGDRLIATYLEHARSSVRIFGLDGSLERDLALPGIGSATGFGGRVDAKETFYAFTSYTSPGAIYHYDLESGSTQLFRAPKAVSYTHLTLPTSDLV